MGGGRRGARGLAGGGGGGRLATNRRLCAGGSTGSCLLPFTRLVAQPQVAPPGNTRVGGGDARSALGPSSPRACLVPCAVLVPHGSVLASDSVPRLHLPAGQHLAGPGPHPDSWPAPGLNPLPAPPPPPRPAAAGQRAAPVRPHGGHAAARRQRRRPAGRAAPHARSVRQAKGRRHEVRRGQCPLCLAGAPCLARGCQPVPALHAF